MTRFALMILLIFGIGAAYAHTDGYKFSPDNGEQVESGLDGITLTFARQVRITRFQLVVLDGEPLDITAEPTLDNSVEIKPKTTLPRGFDTTFKLDFEPFSKGNYAFSWSVVAKDGDVFDGLSQFTVTQ